MSMLAEPRRKVKWSVDPRNTQWSSDKSKFGYQMLTKMGWDESKGLGSKGDGLKSHVKVSVKNNKFGVGTQKSNSDAWIDQQDDFAALLEKLNKNSNDTSKKTKTKSVGLEESVKQSRKKIFYSKLIKSKDLSKASNHDLACIFGQRSKSAPATPQDQSEDEVSKSDESTASCPPVNELVTIKSQYNSQEYFAKRMAELQSRRISNGKISTLNNIDSIAKGDGEDENEVSKKKKKKKKSKDYENGETLQINEDNEQRVDEGKQGIDAQNCVNISKLDSEQVIKSKKKSKRKTQEEQIPCMDSIVRQQDCATQDDIQCVPNSNNLFESRLPGDSEIKRKKSKKKKRKTDDLNQLDDQEDNNESKVTVQNQESVKNMSCLNSDISFEYKEKKEKKKKKKLRHMECEAQINNHESPKREYEENQLIDKLMDGEPSKKKKKKKRKQEDQY